MLERARKPCAQPAECHAVPSSNHLTWKRSYSASPHGCLGRPQVKAVTPKQGYPHRNTPFSFSSSLRSNVYHTSRYRQRFKNFASGKLTLRRSSFCFKPHSRYKVDRRPGADLRVALLTPLPQNHLMLGYSQDIHSEGQRVRDAIMRLSYRRRPVCAYFVRTGQCHSGKACRYEHDANYVRLCPRFLNQSCQLGSSVCLLAHVLDPCRLPLCEFHENGGCNRNHCVYLHKSYPENTPLCPDFLRGRCPRGRACCKRHVWRSSVASRRKVDRTSDRGRISLRGHSRSSAVPSDVAHPVAAIPEGSLRHVFPAPMFIPLMDDHEST
ncbi:unnamed protein product [Dicrocoelium dendriticum]|nr:unnamed protein product [Dicrocoelium dendriticum]